MAYTLTETQKYRLRCRGNRAVFLDYFSNTASFDPERRTFHIQVDDWSEDDWMDSFIEENAEAMAKRLGIEFQMPEDDDEEMRQEEWAQNQRRSTTRRRRSWTATSLIRTPRGSQRTS